MKGVRKATTNDEEFKIIVLSPSFVLHYINEVLRLVFPGRLKDVAYPWHSTCGILTHTLSTLGLRLLTQRFPRFSFTTIRGIMDLRRLKTQKQWTNRVRSYLGEREVERVKMVM